MATRAKQQPANDPAPDKMALWEAVSKTDPAHTKRVNQRGGFTAISAHYQVMSATAAFGPVGIGWGYTNGDPIFHETLVIVPVTLWHGTRENTYGPVYGGAEWKDAKGRLDSDAPKKAATDGLTKALSHLGFNADVFLGRFDDNKYVEQVRREFEEVANDTAPEAREEDPPAKVEGITKIKNSLRAMKTAGDAMGDLAAFNELLTSNRDCLAKIRDANHGWWTGDGEDFEGFKHWIVRRRDELTPPAEDGMYPMLVQSMKECQTLSSLTNWMAANEAVIAELDGAESRSFQLSYDLLESNIRQVSTVRA